MASPLERDMSVVTSEKVAFVAIWAHSKAETKPPFQADTPTLEPPVD
jgi:hypothetical protein